MEIQLVRLLREKHTGRTLSVAESEAAFDAARSGKKIIFAAFEITDEGLVSTLQIAIDMTDVDEREYSSFAYKYAEKFALQIATDI